eukprot:scaffold323801_cov39-Tisochrysis_lutea.AAC.1
MERARAAIGGTGRGGSSTGRQQRVNDSRWNRESTRVNCPALISSIRRGWARCAAAISGQQSADSARHDPMSKGLADKFVAAAVQASTDEERKTIMLQRSTWVAKQERKVTTRTDTVQRAPTFVAGLQNALACYNTNCTLTSRTHTCRENASHLPSRQLMSPCTERTARPNFLTRWRAA